MSRQPDSRQPLESEVTDGVVAVKRCTKCLEPKPVTEFPWAPARRGVARDSRCRQCISAAMRERYQAAPEKAKARASARYAEIQADPERRWLHSLRVSAYHLGLDADAVVARFEGHGGLCDICGEPPAVRHARLFIDHDHGTGELRGLLCHNCNTAIGLLRDSSDLLEQAAVYLEDHGR